MTNIKVNNQIIKNFWTQKITELQKNKSVPDNLLTNWKTELATEDTFAKITARALIICQSIYDKTTVRLKHWEINPLKNLNDLLDSLRAWDDFNGIVIDIMLDYEKQLISHSCSACSHTDYSTIKTQLGQYKSKWDSHNCSGNSPCSHTDYDTIKKERDELKSELAKLTEKLITDCQLGLNKNSSLEQIITKIKENSSLSLSLSDLKKEKENLQSQIVQKDQTITDLQKPNTQTITEIKEKIREKAQKIGINTQSLEKSLTDAHSYQQLVELEQKLFSEKLTEKEKSLQVVNQNNSNLKWGLIASWIVLGIVVIGILVAVFRGGNKRKD